MAPQDDDIRRLNNFIKIIREITSKLDSNRALYLIVKAGSDLTNADFCNISLIKNNNLYFYTPTGQTCNRNIDESILNYVVKTGKPRSFNDVLNEENYKKCNYTTKSQLAVPIKYKNACIGIINVESSRENAFDKYHCDMLMTLAEFAASAIINARHYEELMILRQIDQKITSSLDLEETLNSIKDSASALINTKDIEIRLLEDSKLIPVAGVERDKILAATWLVGDCIIGKVAETMKAILENDVQNNPSFSRALSHIKDEERREELSKINSEIAVPLLVKGNIIGVLNARSPKRDYFTEDDCKLLKAFADQASIAINNALLGKTIREIEELRGAHKINENLSISPDDWSCGMPANLEIFADEFNLIFQKLFWNFDEIWIRILTPGYSGAGVFMVTPVHSLTFGRPVIVKIGPKENIKTEEKNYNAYVKWFIGGMRSTNLMASAYTSSLGAVVYSLIGNPMDDGVVTSFEDYYNGNEDIEKLEEDVNALFNGTCMSWYLRIETKMGDVAEIYKRELSLDLNRLLENYRSIFPRFSAIGHIEYSEIEYPSTNFQFLCPIEWISTHFLKGFQPMSFCITHGDFNKNNIIFDASGNPWLIDFMRTRVSCTLRDFIRLETAIKFEILDSRIGLSSYFNFERALTEHTDFSEFVNDKNIPVFSKNPEEQKKLVKAFRTIKRIRTLAYRVNERTNNLNQYYIGLLMQTIKFFEWSDYNNKDFILISSSLLCITLNRRKLFEERLK